MADLAQPDLRTLRGQLNRFLLAIAAAIGAGLGAWWVALQVAQTRLALSPAAEHKFGGSVGTGLGMLAYWIAHVLLVRRDQRRFEAERVPQARVRR